MKFNIFRAQSYEGLSLRRRIIMALLLLAVLASLLVNVMLGSSQIPLREVLSILFTGVGEQHNPMIVRQLRLPMALMAVVVGAALGVGGCEIQTILKSSIASPYTLGITSAASFGAALGLIVNTNVLQVSEAAMVTGNAFAFALLASALIYGFSRIRGSNSGTIILFGIAQNFLFGALTMVLQYIADDEDLQSLVFWNMGSLLKATWSKFFIVAAVLALSLALLMSRAWELTAMTLDDTKARSLGVDTARLRKLVILITSLLTAVAVSFVGTIGFVGIVAPHIARQMSGEDQRYFLPMSALVGALVVSVAFALSKLVIPNVVLPIGLVTSIIGIPFFLAAIFQKMRWN
ncbi:MAG: iron ABC transporter permease [Tissierellia bacterium]|nr:iron ABC transporter permease [Tissierellia bacterium]